MNLLLCLLLAVTMFCAVEAHAQAPAPPVVYWSAEPVMPGETAMLQGARWDENAVVSLTHLTDTPNASAGEVTQTVRLLDANARSLRFVIPADWQRGVFACRVKTAGGEIERLLNAPQPWWSQGDDGQKASPGGWLRVFGRCLALTQPKLELRRAGQVRALAVREASLWQLAADLPNDVAPGDYELWVHNGCGGSRGWASAGTVAIQPPAAWWKETEFVITDFGATPDDATDDSQAFRQALAKGAENGGGIVRFPPGRFRFAGGFTLPPRVLLKGAGAELTHLSWADSEQPPDALLSSVTGECGLEDLSLYAFNYRTGLSVKAAPDGARARNVLIRRVRARFAPLSVRLKPEVEAARRAAQGRAAVFSISADNVQILDCDLAFTRNIGFSAQGDDVVCRGNRVRADSGGWCPVGGGRRAIVEDNVFDGITTGVTRGAEVYFARNRSAHQYAGFREGFTTDGTYGGPGIVSVAATDGARLTLATPGTRTDTAHIPAAVRILEGPGEGQFRRVLSFDGAHLVMDRPWDVAPDATSVIWAANDMGRHLIVDNEWADCGIAVQLYGGALDCVVSGNRSARSGGFRAWGNNICWYVQFLDNRITEGYGVEGPELNGGQSSIHVVGPYTHDFKGTTARGIVMRGNRLENHAAMLLRAAIHDVLVENNVVRNNELGIVGDLWQRQQGVLLRGNTFERVGQPLSPPEAATRYCQAPP